MWPEIINNTITDHPFDPRTPLTSAQLLKEIRALKQIVGVVYCEREGAPGIQSELKTLNIQVVNVVKYLISNSKRKDSSKLKDQRVQRASPTIFLRNSQSRNCYQ